MSNNIAIGKYYATKSNIHRMNPISKILCLVLFIVMVFLSNTIQLTVILALLVMLMMMNTNISFIIYFQVIKSLRFILLLMILIAAIFRLPVEPSILFIVKFILVIIYVTIITMTTPPTEITYGIEKVLFPLSLFAIPTGKIAMHLTMAIRYIPNLIDQSYKILKSQATRGIDYYHANISGKLIAVKGMIKPMFRLAHRKSMILTNSMEIRLYNIKKKRTNFRKNKWKFFDTYLTIFHIAVIVLILFKGVKII